MTQKNLRESEGIPKTWPVRVSCYTSYTTSNIRNDESMMAIERFFEMKYQTSIFVFAWSDT